MPANDEERELHCQSEEGCRELLVCYVCESCAAHCVFDDPDTCWQTHEDWRLGKADPAFGDGETVARVRPGTVPRLPKPRWRR